MIRTLLTFAAVLPVLLVAGFHAQSASAQAASGAAAGKSGAPSLVVNINTASAADLESLPGVGPKTAALIVEYRQKNGPFKKIEELMNVRGVGEKSFLKLKAQITVGQAKAEHAPQDR